MAKIKKGTYRFNDVLTGNVTENAVEALFNFTDGNGDEWGYLTFQFFADGTSSVAYVNMNTGAMVGANVNGWKSPAYQIVNIPTDQEIQANGMSAAEFATWFTANTKLVGGDAVTIEYNGNVIASFTHGTKAIRCNGAVMQGDVVVNVPEMGGAQENEVDKFFAENFPSDTWGDGEYTGTIQGIPATMRYKYRKSQPDPKDIAFVTTIQKNGTVGDYDTTANLADWYLKTVLVECGRIQTDSGVSNSVLIDNPVIPTMYDLSPVYSAMVGLPVTATLKATQCGLKTYEEGVYNNLDTKVNYFIETNATELAGEKLPEMLYALAMQLAWYHERSYAYGGRDIRSFTAPIEIITENGTYTWHEYQGYWGIRAVAVRVPDVPEWDGSIEVV